MTDQKRIARAIKAVVGALVELDHDEQINVLRGVEAALDVMREDEQADQSDCTTAGLITIHVPPTGTNYD